ncbi:MAG TPA: hypothetical protein VFO60_09190 [Candidatus Dormibacteraeota bacterium]|nr:hypothetical protein [Candidatus Dormibacteraeota bacterium]
MAIAQVSALDRGLAGAASTLPRFKDLIAQDDSVVDGLDAHPPASVAADVHTLRAAFDQVNANVQSAAALKDLSGAFAPFGAAAVATAISDLNTYGTTTCGFTTASST